MPGPPPHFYPAFPEEFLETARTEIRRKTAPHRCVQRYQLALLVHEHPQWSAPTLGRCVGLSGRQVQHWRKRWAAGDFGVDDRAGRGRKADFPPSGPGARQSPGLRARRRDRAAVEPPILE